MNRISRTFTMACLSVPFLAGAAAAEDTLYTRLGGYDAIAAVTDDFLGQLVTDERFKRFFLGASNDTKKRIRQHVVDLICEDTGGPCFYTGRDLRVAHAGLGITKAEWDASIEAMLATLNRLNVPEQEQKDLGALLGPLEKDIVEEQ